MDKKKNTKETEKLNRLLNFIYDDEGLNPEDVKEALAEYNINQDELVENGLRFIKSLEKQQRIEKAQAIKRKLVKAYGEFISSYKGQALPKDAFIKLKELLSPEEQKSQLALAFFHKLESIPKEETQNILSDTEFLKTIEEELRKLDSQKDE